MPRGLHSQAAKVSARSAGIEFRVRHAAGSINPDAHADAQSALKSASRFLGHVGDNTPNDLS